MKTRKKKSTKHLVKKKNKKPKKSAKRKAVWKKKARGKKNLSKREEREKKLQYLVLRGRERGFVTYDEILKEFPTISGH